MKNKTELLFRFMLLIYLSFLSYQYLIQDIQPSNFRVMYAIILSIIVFRERKPSINISELENNSRNRSVKISEA